MTGYSLLIFVHVLAASLWVGGAVMSWLVSELALNDREWFLKNMQYEERLANMLFIPSSLVTLLAGIALVWRGGYEISHGWVAAGLGLWIVMFIVGMSVFAPAGAKIKKAIEEHGPHSDQVRDQLLFVRNVARVDIVILITVVFLMTTKPF
jgi:uncharacterized membrane protein